MTTTIDPTTTDTYRTIAARLTMFRPQIDLAKYLGKPNPDVRLYDEKPYIRHQLQKYGLAAAATTLDGITFLPNEKWADLIETLSHATDGRVRISAEQLTSLRAYRERYGAN